MIPEIMIISNFHGLEAKIPGRNVKSHLLTFFCIFKMIISYSVTIMSSFGDVTMIFYGGMQRWQERTKGKSEAIKTATGHLGSIGEDN
jgi:hypothetical protein